MIGRIRLHPNLDPQRLARLERRRQFLYAAYREAASDAAFLADMAAVSDAFDPAIGDGLDAEQHA